MFVTREEVKVYHPEEGKAIKLTKDGKIISYMVVPYYALPQYDFQVEEVDISEAEKYKEYIVASREADLITKLIIN